MPRLVIRRFCGHERLPRGERYWRRLAAAVRFSGTLYVYGYGVGGRPGVEQRRCYRTGDADWTMGDYGPGEIRVWLPCSCAAVEFDPDLDLAVPHDLPLTVYAHELGHHVQRTRSKGYLTDAAEEAVASRYGRWLLRSVR